MSDKTTETQMQESPQSRLVGAGYARSIPPFWMAPGDGHIVTEEQALAELAEATEEEGSRA